MNKFYKITADNKGFTMIEAIAVLIILGIITAVAVSRVMSTQQDLIAQADIVKSHLRFAQLKALQDDTATSWGINFVYFLPPDLSYYTLYNNGDTAITSNLPGEDGKTHTFPAGVEITNVTPTTTVNFDSWGRPVDSLTGSPLPGNTTVTLNQSGSTPIVITVSANTGFITP